MKKPLPLQLAESYCDARYGFNNHEYDAFLAGYDAAKLIIEAELASLEANRCFQEVRQPTPHDAETTLRLLLERLEGEV